MNKKFKNWFLVILWAGLIFLLSHQPGLKSDLPGSWDFLLRKIAHISEYAVLTFLLMKALQAHQLPRRKVWLWAIALAILYAISDEYHQTFILDREGTGRDVLIDSLGVILVAWFNKRKMLK
jgi:VanZ family protein